MKALLRLRWRYRYEEQCPRLAAALGDVLLRNETVIDVGCGSGYLLTGGALSC